MLTCMRHRLMQPEALAIHLYRQCWQTDLLTLEFTVGDRERHQTTTGIQVRIIEQVLAAEGRLDQSPAGEGDPVGAGLPDSFSLSAEDMRDMPNVLALERTQSGLAFRWTGANACTTFQLPVSRASKRGLSIDIVAVVVPEYCG